MSYVVLLFATGQWVRIVPSDWAVVPNALSAALPVRVARVAGRELMGRVCTTRCRQWRDRAGRPPERLCLERRRQLHLEQRRDLLDGLHRIHARSCRLCGLV
ncbi:hypothetical protein [Nonomuraea sp. NPDC048916]|uniref:hypothetical protein n=1 Tax=Nonomuraea sp. NPDC048916 TaxID=3154232 RepID=UPI0033F61A28